MCGIIAYKGNIPISLGQTIELAYRNRHRGEDGIGIIYEEDGKLKVIKNLYSLTELHEGKLSEDLYYKRVRVGSFEYTCKDEDVYKENQESFKKYVDKISSKKSKFVYLHHRKGTYGEITLENQHPILINDKYYIHNGTAYGIDTVKKYLELMEGCVFNTETDTEVLAVLYNKLMDRFDGDKDKVYKEMTGMFRDGFGILIEIDKNENVTIIKDFLRDIWYYGFKGGYLLSSEGNPNIKEYYEVGYLPEDIIDMNNIEYIDDMENYKLADEGWNELTYNSAYYRESIGTCEICKNEKLVRSNIQCSPHPIHSGTYKKVCFNCILNWKPNTKKEISTIDDKMKQFGKYIGKEYEEPIVMEYANT